MVYASVMSVWESWCGEWRSQAACKGLDNTMFFPERGQTALAGLRVCVGCPVKVPCLRLCFQSQDANDDYGVFGGTTRADRSRWRRRLAGDYSDANLEAVIADAATRPRGKGDGTILLALGNDVT